MENVKIKILNPDVILEIRKMAGMAARLTQHGEKISNVDDFMELYNKPVSDKFLENLCELPHPILQHLNKINIAIIGISRREMTQLVRHRYDVHFISSSLQYSNFSNNYDFFIPYEIIEKRQEKGYLSVCKKAMQNYKAAIEIGINNDTAGYMSPQALRNVLIMSATPFELKHIISQRVCNRNTSGTQYVMLKIWEELYKLDPILFAMNTTGSFCQKDKCREGKMACKCPFGKDETPTDILKRKFPLLYKEVKDENKNN